MDVLSFIHHGFQLQSHFNHTFFPCVLRIRFIIFFSFLYFFFIFHFSYAAPSIPLVYCFLLGILNKGAVSYWFLQLSKCVCVCVCAMFFLQSQSAYDNLISDWFKYRDALPALSASSLPRIPTWSGIYQKLIDCQHRSHDVPDYVVNYMENTVTKQGYLSDDRLQFSAENDPEYFCYCSHSQTGPLVSTLNVENKRRNSHTSSVFTF